MRIIEILLKLAFLAISAYMVIVSLSHESFNAFLIVSVLLGLTLIFNRNHPSYKYLADYKYNNRVIMMRRIEGILILAFAAVAGYIAFA
jgi:hypothetical protein